MVNQTLIAGTLVGVCEARVYARKAGLDVERVLASVGSGAAGSWTLANLAPRALAGDFAPGFYVDHFVKDMGIALGEARAMQASLPALALVEQLCIALQAAGHGRDGTQSLVSLVASLSGLSWERA
jgi:3-hydroxyisobutyrate dehydrogenase